MKKTLFHALLYCLLISNLPFSSATAKPGSCTSSGCQQSHKKPKRGKADSVKKQKQQKKEMPSSSVKSEDRIIDIKKPELFETIQSIQLQIPVVIKAGATWCPPCQRSIQPFHELAQHYNPGVDALFCTMTVENRPALSQGSLLSLFAEKFDLNFKSIPVFIILYRNEKHVIHGSDQIDQIKPILKKLHKKHDRLPSIQEKSFDKTLANSKKLPVVIKIHAFWCPPCSAMESIFENVAKQFKNKAKFLRLDSVENPELAHKVMYDNKIEGLPAVLFVKNGVVVKTLTGSMQESELAQQIKSIL